MILLVAPRYNPSVTTMLAQQFEHQPGIRIIEDRRTKERRTKPLMMERTRRHLSRRGSMWSFKGAFINESENHQSNN